MSDSNIGLSDYIFFDYAFKFVKLSFKSLKSRQLWQSILPNAFSGQPNSLSYCYLIDDLILDQACSKHCKKTSTSKRG